MEFHVFGTCTDSFTFLNVGDDHVHFEEGEEFNLDQRPNRDDVSEIRVYLQQATCEADCTVASPYVHKGARVDPTTTQSRDDGSHVRVDAGTDFIFGHGPQGFHEIDVYDAAPKFYSLRNFLIQCRTITELSADSFEAYDFDSLRVELPELFANGSSTEFLHDDRTCETAVQTCMT